jgi:protein-arginine kinase
LSIRDIISKLRGVVAAFLADEQGARKRDIKQFDDAVLEIEHRIGRD